MSDLTSSAGTPVPAHVTAFNTKVAGLIKEAQPGEIADIVSHPGSLLKTAAGDNNNGNQNHSARTREDV